MVKIIFFGLLFVFSTFSFAKDEISFKNSIQYEFPDFFVLSSKNSSYKNLKTFSYGSYFRLEASIDDNNNSKYFVIRSLPNQNESTLIDIVNNRLSLASESCLEGFNKSDIQEYNLDGRQSYSFIFSCLKFRKWHDVNSGFTKIVNISERNGIILTESLTDYKLYSNDFNEDKKLIISEFNKVKLLAICQKPLKGKFNKLKCQK